MKFTSLPKLTTERLILKKIESSDCKTLLFIRTDKTINQFIKRKKTETEDDIIKFIEKINTGIINSEWLYWSISLKGDEKMIGTICLWNFSKNRKTVEVGYELTPDFQKKGIASEALKCVINFGFNELKLSTVEAFTHKNNKNSQNLLEKNNFKLNSKRKDKGNDDIMFEIKNPRIIPEKIIL